MNDENRRLLKKRQLIRLGIFVIVCCFAIWTEVGLYFLGLFPLYPGAPIVGCLLLVVGYFLLRVPKDLRTKNTR